MQYRNKELQYHFAGQLDKKYVLSGASGSGKSTLLRALTHRVPYKGKWLIENPNRQRCMVLLITHSPHVAGQKNWQHVKIEEICHAQACTREKARPAS